MIAGLLSEKEGEVEPVDNPVDKVLSRKVKRTLSKADNTRLNLLSKNESMKVVFSDN